VANFVVHWLQEKMFRRLLRERRSRDIANPASKLTSEEQATKEKFFNSKATGWPKDGLQRRMQSSRG
jgi:hypothetical protein